MLSKCANPNCSASFLYLHQGRLFRFEVEARKSGKLAAVRDGPARKAALHIEYFWLCDSCLSTTRLVQENGSQVKAIPLLFLKAAS